MKRVASLALLFILMAGAGSARAVEPITLPGARAFPESVGSSKDGTLYVGSFAEGGITRIRPGAAPETFVKPGADGTRSTFGVLVDDAHGKLWVCSNDLSKVLVPGPSTVEGAWLKGFDLADGKLAASARLPGSPALCNDIAIGPDGAAYVTDTLSPNVLRLRPGADALEGFATDPRWFVPGGFGLDGIAFDTGGNLIVNLFSRGELYKVDVSDNHAGAVHKLTASRKLTLPDAIRPFGDGSFLMIEGGGSLDRVTVNGDKAEVVPLKTGLDGPTGVTRVGDIAWVAEGRLSQVHDAEITQPFRLVPVPLPKTPEPTSSKP